MKIVLQRVKEARVDIGGNTVGRIGRGLCLLVGIETGDGEADAEYLARKCVELRIFPDAQGKMNLSLAEAGGEVLAVSQFTLAEYNQRKRGKDHFVSRVLAGPRIMLLGAEDDA